MDYVNIGIGLAFTAMLCWGFGDFLIQRSTRAVGDWEALFIVAFIGAVVILPFVATTLPQVLWMHGSALLIFGAACVVLFFAAILDFVALRVGKLAAVEPIWSIEIPASAFLAFILLRERISLWQGLIIALLMLGLFLVSLREKYKIKKFFVERGVLLALLAGILMGGANFFIGWGSRIADPLTVNFITDVFLIFATGAYLLFNGRLWRIFRDFRANIKVLLPTGIIDKAAWVAFAFSMTLAPIAIAVALSESYIIIAVILGLTVNKEKLEKHQKFGLVLAIFSAIILSVMTTIRK